MLLYQADSLCAYGQHKRPTVCDVAHIAEVAHAVQRDVIVLAIVGHLAYVVLVLQEQALLVEHYPIGLKVLRVEMVHPWHCLDVP